MKELKNINLKGVMTILPRKTTKKETKDMYIKTKKIQKHIQKTHIKSCTNISMGMSKDFEIAIKCGATHIRIGTLLYGKRTR